MSANSIPELEGLSGRAFSFYPPILNVEHNEWKLREATWSEILVGNTKDGQEIWVPRRFMGAISRVEEPVMIVTTLAGEQRLRAKGVPAKGVPAKGVPAKGVPARAACRPG